MVGTVQELWRYPVSSVGGERVDELPIGPTGVVGDRVYLLVDLDSGEIARPEAAPRWRPALHLAARTDHSTTVVHSCKWERDIADVSAGDRLLSEHFGFACGIRRAGTRIDTAAGPQVLQPRYSVAPLHLLTTATLSSLSVHLPNSMPDVRRFRPNILVETAERETEWLGRKVEAGIGFSGIISEGAKRCGMTLVSQPGIPEDASILRHIVRNMGRKLGVYLEVISDGIVVRGDTVSVT